MSDFCYRPETMLCSDFESRRVWVKRHRFDGSLAADTFFSVPAYIHHKGKRLHGFISRESDETRFYASALLEPLSDDTKRDAKGNVGTCFWYSRRPETTRAQRIEAMERAASHGLSSPEIFAAFGRV